MELILDNAVFDFVKSNISNEYFILFLLSLLPVTELRLSVPIGILLFKLPWFSVFVICVISNALIGILLVFSLGWGISIASKISFVKPFLDRMLVLSKEKYKRYERYKSYALMLFVGIPFPGTGAWTGALISYAIGLNKASTVFAIAKGVIISGIIMTSLSLSGKIIVG